MEISKTTQRTINTTVEKVKQVSYLKVSPDGATTEEKVSLPDLFSLMKASKRKSIQADLQLALLDAGLVKEMAGAGLKTKDLQEMSQSGTNLQSRMRALALPTRDLIKLDNINVLREILTDKVLYNMSLPSKREEVSTVLYAVLNYCVRLRDGNKSIRTESELHHCNISNKSLEKQDGIVLSEKTRLESKTLRRVWDLLIEYDLLNLKDIPKGDIRWSRSRNWTSTMKSIEEIRGYLEENFQIFWVCSSSSGSTIHGFRFLKGENSPEGWSLRKERKNLYERFNSLWTERSLETYEESLKEKSQKEDQEEILGETEVMGQQSQSEETSSLTEATLLGKLVKAGLVDLDNAKSLELNSKERKMLEELITASSSPEEVIIEVIEQLPEAVAV